MENQETTMRDAPAAALMTLMPAFQMNESSGLPLCARTLSYIHGDTEEEDIIDDLYDFIDMETF